MFIEKPEVCLDYDDKLFKKEVYKMTKAYCVKCKTKREMLNPKKGVSANKRNFMSGTCPKCGTKMFVFV